MNEFEYRLEMREELFGDWTIWRDASGYNNPTGLYGSIGQVRAQITRHNQYRATRTFTTPTQFRILRRIANRNSWQEIDFEDNKVGDLRNVRWYVLVDDLVGGWAVANVDKGRVSALDWRQGDSTVGEFISEELALYIVKRHNMELDMLQALKEGDYRG